MLTSKNEPLINHLEKTSFSETSFSETNFSETNYGKTR